MRILHVYRTYFPDTQGGLEEVIRQICLNSLDHGVESRVFALTQTHDPEVVDQPEAQVHRAKQHAEIASCGLSFKAGNRFRELVDWADVVHYHFPWPFADFLHIYHSVQKPCIVTYHSDIVRQRLLGKLYRPLMNRLLSSVDRIVCTSPNYFATSNVLQRFSDKVEVIPIGLNQDSYPNPNADQLAAVEKDYGRAFFLFVGVLRYYKGLHILLEAIENSSIQVVIAGSGPTERELRAQAESLGLKNVTFAGSVDEVTKVCLFELSVGIVFPSYLRSEAFGVTLLEGAMFGKPLISAEVGSGTSHVNVDGKTGYVVAPGSAADLRKAMEKIVANPKIAAHLGAQAKQRYKALFTGRLMGARYTSLYQNVLGNEETATQPTVQLPTSVTPKPELLEPTITTAIRKRS